MRINIAFLLLVLLPVLPTALLGKSFKGKVLEKDSQIPLAYVNVGLVSQNLGTVTDEQGVFELEIPDKFGTATMRFSLIGYVPLEMQIVNFFEDCQQDECIFYLEKINYELKTVTYKAKDVAKKVVGNKLVSSNTKMGFHDNRKGYEMGMPIEIEERPAYLERLIFYIYDCKYDTIFYRLNVYKMENGQPTENILRKAIYLKYPKSAIKKKLTVHLTPYNIYVEGDFMVSLELVKNLYGQGLFLGTALANGHTFFRTTSQADWQQIPVGIGMRAVIMQEKR